MRLIQLPINAGENTCGDCKYLRPRFVPECHLFNVYLNEEGEAEKPLRHPDCLASETPQLPKIGEKRLYMGNAIYLDCITIQHPETMVTGAHNEDSILPFTLSEWLALPLAGEKG